MKGNWREDTGRAFQIRGHSMNRAMGTGMDDMIGSRRRRRLLKRELKFFPGE